MLCTNIVVNVKTKQNKTNFCTQHVVNLHFSGNSMNNLQSYCELTDARMRASEKDSPVKKGKQPNYKILVTGKSFSEALILASVNPQHDKRLFIEFPEKYKFRTCCAQKLLFFVLKFKTMYKTCSDLVFFGEFNEQSLVILWVN